MAGITTKASGLRSATTIVDVASATAPSSGQVLTATSSTAATWQTPSSGGSSTAIDSTTGSWWNMQIPPSTALASGTPTYTGIIEYSAASDGQALQWYLPSIQGGTSDKMIFSDVKRVIARLYYRRTSGTSLMGFGFADQGSYVGDAVATAGIRACFTWTDASTLYAVTSDGAGTPTSTSITSPPTSGNWNEYIVDYDKTNSSAKFYVNGTLKATHTTELPADGSSCRFVIGVGGSVAGSFSYPIISIKQL